MGKPQKCNFTFSTSRKRAEHSITLITLFLVPVLALCRASCALSRALSFLVFCALSRVPCSFWYFSWCLFLCYLVYYLVVLVLFLVLLVFRVLFLRLFLVSFFMFHVFFAMLFRFLSRAFPVPVLRPSRAWFLSRIAMFFVRFAHLPEHSQRQTCKLHFLKICD